MQDRPNILIVEDEPLIRTSLSMALEDESYRPIEAWDGRSALEIVQSNHSLSGVISDIRLGDGPNGWEVVRQARSRHPKIAVVYVTGDSASDWASEGVPNSVLLQKPFSVAEVITAISTLLNAAEAPPVQADRTDGE